jgi:ubiquinol-cytochrome c reductase cytochrome c1 subunit
MRPALISLLAAFALSPMAQAAPHFGFTAPLGTYNKATLQAGFAVYQAECAACHAISAVRNRDLIGLGLNPAAIARLRAVRPPMANRNANRPAAPDLSLITTALPHGPASIVALLRVHHPLAPGSITLAGGVKPSPAIMAHDVAEFLAWSADPTLDQRKSIMLRAMIYLAIFGLIGFFALRQDRTP